MRLLKRELRPNWGYSKITQKIGLKTNCYIGHLQEGAFGAITMRDAAQRVELNGNQHALVAILLPVLLDIPLEKQVTKGMNITNCSKRVSRKTKRSHSDERTAWSSDFFWKTHLFDVRRRRCIMAKHAHLFRVFDARKTLLPCRDQCWTSVSPYQAHGSAIRWKEYRYSAFLDTL